MEEGEKRLKQEDCNEDKLGAGILTLTNRRLAFDKTQSRMMDFSKVGIVGITYVFQKLTNEDFKVPYQGNFLSFMQKNSGYQLQFLPHPPSRTYVPGFASADLKSYSAVTLLKAAVKKVLQKFR